MTPDDLAYIIAQFFPNNTGVILTGSQSLAKTFIDKRDIDIVIFNPNPGNIVYSIIPHDGFYFDVTILPLTDIANIIDNESFDPKGVLLNKILTGTILIDKNGFVKLISSIVSEIYGKSSYNISMLHRQQIADLKKFQKYFGAAENHHDGALLKTVLFDWHSKITAVEAYKLLNYLHGPAQKHKLLIQKNPNFLNEVNELATQALITGDFNKVADYNSSYCTTIRKVFKYEPQPNAKLIIDVGYDDFSLSHFILNVFCNLREHEVLQSCFERFYLSPVKYSKKYQNKVCIVFSLAEPRVKYYKILSIVRAYIFNNAGLQNPRVSVWFDENEAIPAIHNLRLDISRMIFMDFLEKAELNTSVRMNLIFECLDKLRLAINLNQSDLLLVYSYLMQNWIFYNGTAIHTKNLAIITDIYKKSTQACQSYYLSQWSSVLPSMIQNKIFNVPAHLSQLSSAIAMTAEHIDKSESCSTRDFKSTITYKACETFGFDDVRTSYWFIILIEEAFQSINLSYLQKQLAFYCYLNAFLAEGAKIPTVNDKLVK